MASSMYPMLENHMAFPDHRTELPEPEHFCEHCEEDIPDLEDDQVVVVLTLNPNLGAARGRYLHHYFCNLNCRSQAFYAATDTASGKADLFRLVAALSLIAETQCLHRTPMRKFELDDFGPANNPSDTTTFSEFRERAMQLLNILAPGGHENWTDEPIAAADELAETLWKAVKL